MINGDGFLSGTPQQATAYRFTAGDLAPGRVADRQPTGVAGRCGHHTRSRTSFVWDRPTIRMPGGGQRQGADPGRAHPQDGDLVVTHQRVGGFSASQLDHLLRARGVNTVLFTGVATNFVEGTARQASDLGYRTIIVADACSAADPATHDASIASLGLLAEIATSAEVLEALSVTATPVTLNV